MTQHTITPNVTEAIQSVSKDRSDSYRLQPLFLLRRNAQRHFSSKASSSDAEQACLSLCINHDPNRPRPRQQSQHINGSVFFKIKKQNKTFSNSGFTLLSDYFNKMKMECWASVLARASRSVSFFHCSFHTQKVSVCIQIWAAGKQESGLPCEGSCVSTALHISPMPSQNEAGKSQQDKPLAIYTKISAKEDPRTHSIHHSESHRFKND